MGNAGDQSAWLQRELDRKAAETFVQPPPEWYENLPKVSVRPKDFMTTSDPEQADLSKPVPWPDCTCSISGMHPPDMHRPGCPVLAEWKRRKEL